MKLFNQVQMRRPKKSKFDLSHEVKMTLDFGKLYPILTHDVMPGDSFKVNTEMLIRLQPLLSPVMHRINATIHYFYVPNRILWNEWEDFITGGKDGTSAPLAPYYDITQERATYFSGKSVLNYMGLPPIQQAVTTPIRINLFALAAYQKIWDDYYRDSTLQNEIFVPLTSGDNASTIGPAELLYRNLERDYFTSAMPWAQRGPEVILPSDITYKAASTGTTLGNPSQGAATFSTGVLQDASGGVQLENIESLGITIRDLRQSNRLQEWLEKNAVAGGRYVEQILAHFGIHTGDARIQRAEYLGGGKQPIVFSEVLQTSGSPAETGYTETPLGEMAGHGISAGNNAGFNHTFKEHGYIIGLLSVMPVNTYQQGIQRHLTRFDKLEFPWPEFAQIGEQEIKNKEIYLQGETIDEATFGYQSRYSEMKYIPGRVCGDFTNSLDYWHLGRKFSTLPSLNSSFIEAKIDKRIFAVEDPQEDSLLCNIYHNISAIRPLPYFGTPTL